MTVRSTYASCGARRLGTGHQLDIRSAGKDLHLMSAGTITMSDTRLSLLVRVRNLGDGRSWDEFHAIYAR